MGLQDPSVYSSFLSYLVTVMTKGLKPLWKKACLVTYCSSLSFTSSAVGRVPHSADKVILNGRNPWRSSIDPAHNFTQSSTFAMLAGMLSLLLILGLTLNSQEELLDDFSYSLLSLPLDHIINVIICKEGSLNALLHKWNTQSFIT